MNTHPDAPGHRSFAWETRAQRVLFGHGTLARVATEVEAMGARKALVLCTPQQREQIVNLVRTFAYLSDDEEPKGNS